MSKAIAFISLRESTDAPFVCYRVCTARNTRGFGLDETFRTADTRQGLT
jgi:hypothetical protein